MKLEHLTSLSNLRLAWRRITTGTNHQYKRYFRDLYYAYETAIEDNLHDLQLRLRGVYKATAPTRVYVPKPSGLQRPISLLTLEDQIIYQAIANRVALKVAKGRKPLEFTSVFSNIPEPDPSNIFFLKSWHGGYAEFQEKIREHFNHGFRWVAQFDLAAFYDTISHQLLLQVACPRSGHFDSHDTIARWLGKWSTEHSQAAYAHGIPQGPIASDFLAECVLLPIDKVLANEFTYVRYVDDIRLFGSSRKDVSEAAIRMEVECRERGLIPQSKKYAINEARTVEEAMGALPSIPPPDAREPMRGAKLMSSAEAVTHFRSALSHTRPQTIEDKTRARHVLYHAEASTALLSYVLRFLPRHPEHIDAFVFYFNNYSRSRRIVRACTAYLQETPYEYVQGELWHVIARMMTATEMKGLLKAAIEVAKNPKRSFTVKWGACHFLCAAESAGIGAYGKFMKHQKSGLLLALLAPVIPRERYVRDEVVEHMLRERSCEAGIALAAPLGRLGMNHSTFGVTVKSLGSQVQNVFRSVGLIRRCSGKVDPIGEILAQRYTIPLWPKWKALFGREYIHALQLLAQADPVFDSGRSFWLGYQNSFNHALFIAMQGLLDARALPGAMRLKHPSGKPINYGLLLKAGDAFDMQYPNIAGGFRQANDRRNSLPGSHPYNFKGGGRTTHLRKGEQKTLAAALKKAYENVIVNFDSIV